MRRSRLMVATGILGLMLGIPLVVGGWEGLQSVIAFLDRQGPRVLGGIVVVLSIAVLIRQGRSAPPASSPPRPPAPEQAGVASPPEPPPA